jgi:flagellar assembly factor FliW
MVEPSGALTVNLCTPIVINPRTMLGQQVMPLDPVYPLRHVLIDAECC